MLTTISRLLGCFALASTLGISAHAQGERQGVRIGVVGPFTGPSADFGVPMLNGIKLAVDEINAVGGYLGRPIELVVKDDKGQPDLGLAQSEALAAEKIVAAIGFCNTGVAMKALHVFQSNKIPLIIPCATGTPLTTKYPATESYIFRTSAQDGIQAPFIVEEALKRGWDKVAVFADVTGYGEAGLKDVEKALGSKGLSPAFVARFPLGIKDLTEPLRAAKAAGANVVLSYTVGPENAVLALGRRAIKWNVPMVGAWPLSFPSFIQGGGDAAEGALMVQTFIAEPSNERRATFLRSYNKAFATTRIPVPMAAAQSYDSAYLMTYALFGVKNQEITGPAVKASLENLQRVHYGVVATYEKPFSVDDKDAITSNMLVIGQVKAGAIAFAYPADAKRNLFVQRKIQNRTP